ncbi:MAG: DUF4185 domain-containing protein [Smithellaceae bacterium]
MNWLTRSDKINKNTACIILLCLSILITSCSIFRPEKYPVQLPQAQCLPSFPDQDGWYGADGAYSIRLDEKRTLWLFGDTFVSEEQKRKDRIGMDVLLGTTVAISTCSENATFKIKYYLKKKNGKFVSSFGDNEFLWPQDPFIAQGVLYIPLLIIVGLPENPPPFNFKIGGHKIVRIKDFRDENPNLWPVDYLDWTQALAPGIEALATTSVVHDQYVYFYPLYRYTKDNVNISGNILARIPIDHLSNPTNHFEYLTKNNGWQKKLHPKEVKIIFSADLSELSVRYHAEDQQWMAVYLTPEKKGHQLLYSTARSLEGPWSTPSVLIETIAEVDPASPLYDQHSFCYAGKEHRQFAQNGNIVITYVCNSFEDINYQESFIRKNIFLYRPAVKNIKR